VRRSEADDLTSLSLSRQRGALQGVDVGTPDAGQTIVAGLNGRKVDLVVLVAGVLKPETFDEPKWEDEELMYKVCAIGPVFVASALCVSGSPSRFHDRGGPLLLEGCLQT
jgi:hypothetical protein